MCAAAERMTIQIYIHMSKTQPQCMVSVPVEMSLKNSRTPSRFQPQLLRIEVLRNVFKLTFTTTFD